MWSDRSPASPGYEGLYGATIDPSINRLLWSDPKRFVEAVAKCRDDNGGRWVYPLHEFANLIFDGTERICFEAINIALDTA
jgi:hypothetical protein